MILQSNLPQQLRNKDFHTTQWNLNKKLTYVDILNAYVRLMVERICKYKQIDDEHLAPDAIMGLLGSKPHEGPTFTPRMLAKRKTTTQGWIPRYQP